MLLGRPLNIVDRTLLRGHQIGYDCLSFEKMLLGRLLNIVDWTLLHGHQTAYQHDSVQSWWPIAAKALIDRW